MPCYMHELKKLLVMRETGLGGVVGFPSGAQSTAVKIAEVHEHRALAAMELDMVTNVGQDAGALGAAAVAAVAVGLVGRFQPR